MNIIGLIFIVLLCVMDGCVIYAVYAKCDIGKFGLGYVTSNDQVRLCSLDRNKLTLWLDLESHCYFIFSLIMDFFCKSK